MWNPLNNDRGWQWPWTVETDETKQKRILPRKHSDWVWSLSFSPDGRFLASADLKEEIIIWSTEVRNWRGKMCNWVCAVCCCRFTSRNGSTNRKRNCFIIHFIFFPFHFQTWTPLFTGSLGNASPCFPDLSWMQLDSLGDPIAYKLAVDSDAKVAF